LPSLTSFWYWKYDWALSSSFGDEKWRGKEKGRRALTSDWNFVQQEQSNSPTKNKRPYGLGLCNQAVGKGGSKAWVRTLQELLHLSIRNTEIVA